VNCFLLPTAYCLLPTAYCLLPTAYCLLPTAYYSARSESADVSKPHGSWLNLIESFFGKMAKTLLRGIRVKSKEELKTRLETYLREVNEEPVVFRWKYNLETLSVVQTY
jgi:hypothetical protein